MQLYAKMPAVLNWKVKVSVGSRKPEFQTLVVEVEVCWNIPLFVQRTESPTWMLTVGGRYSKSMIDTFDVIWNSGRASPGRSVPTRSTKATRMAANRSMRRCGSVFMAGTFSGQQMASKGQFGFGKLARPRSAGQGSTATPFSSFGR